MLFFLVFIISEPPELICLVIFLKSVHVLLFWPHSVLRHLWSNGFDELVICFSNTYQKHDYSKTFLLMLPKISSRPSGLMIWSSGGIGSDKRSFMVVQVTGCGRNTVKLVCRLQAGELPWEVGWHVDEIWMEFPRCCCESLRCLPSQTLLLIHSLWVMGELTPGASAGLKWDHFCLVLSPVPGHFITVLF